MSVYDVTDAMNEMLVPATLIYDRRGEYINGEWVNGVPAEISINIVIQPASAARILKILPEAPRNIDAVDIWTEHKISSGNSETGEIANVIFYDGKRYKVAKVKNYGALGGYYEALCYAEE